MIESICQKCGNKKMFSDDKSGKKYKCPNCNEVVIIESIGMSITNEHQAKVTNTYADSIEKAEKENEAAERQQKYQKLLGKSKNWNGWGTFFYIITAIAIAMIFSGDYSQVISLFLWGGLGFYFKKKSKEFKESADNYFSENLANSSVSTTESIPHSQVPPLVNEPIIFQTAEEIIQPEETLEYPQPSNKNKYIIGGLIVVAIILGILFLMQREKSTVASTLTTTDNAVVQESVQQPINTSPEPSLPKEETKSITPNELNQQFGVYAVATVKAYFYNDNKGIDKRKGYVSSGDLVQVGNIDGGFGFAAFISSDDKITKGWINMNDLKKSDANISVLPDPDKILPAVEVFTFYSSTTFEEIKTLFIEYCNPETSSSSEDTFTGYGKNNSCILIQVNKQDGKCKIEYSWQCDSGGH